MKYYVSINDKQYEVEVEKGRAEVLNVTAVQEAAPVPVAPVSAAPAPAAPAAVAAPAPIPAAAPAGSGEAIPAPLPGSIMEIRVNAGDAVKAGQILVILEAMKMENEILAPRDGTVTQVAAQKGATVETGTPLLYLQ